MTTGMGMFVYDWMSSMNIFQHTFILYSVYVGQKEKKVFLISVHIAQPRAFYMSWMHLITQDKMKKVLYIQSIQLQILCCIKRYYCLKIFRLIYVLRTCTVSLLT